MMQELFEVENQKTQIAIDGGGKCMAFETLTADIGTQMYFVRSKSSFYILYSVTSRK